MSFSILEWLDTNPLFPFCVFFIKSLQQTIAGNLSLCLPENKLGDYYLDNMYFLEVKAYLSAPSVWWCADWIGVNNKKRTAISQLRKLLETNESCVNIVTMQNEEYEEGFKLLITD